MTFAVSIPGPCVRANCVPPAYRLGAVWVDDPGVLIRNISVPLREFGPERLVCLAEKLKGRYPNKKRIIVNIFSSREASRASQGFLTQAFGREGIQMLSQLHAQFVLNVREHEEYVELIPLPLFHMGDFPKKELYDTRIDLPAPDVVQCHLEINGRCLIALDQPYYPDEALKAGASGTVELAGTISRDGMVRHVTVSEADIAPNAASELLSKAAAENLSTWRLEPSDRQQSMHVQYLYRLRNATVSQPEQLQFNLPQTVVITAKAGSR